MKKPRKYQISLASFLWMIFAIACFFAGKHFDDLAEFAISSDNQKYKTVRILVGNSTTINTNARIPTILIDNPSVCDIKPTTPTSIQIRAKKPGLATLTFVDEVGLKTNCQIEVSK